jgi:hypothetical protein
MADNFLNALGVVGGAGSIGSVYGLYVETKLINDVHRTKRLNCTVINVQTEFDNGHQSWVILLSFAVPPSYHPPPNATHEAIIKDKNLTTQYFVNQTLSCFPFSSNLDNVTLKRPTVSGKTILGVVILSVLALPTFVLALALALCAAYLGGMGIFYGALGIFAIVYYVFKTVYRTFDAMFELVIKGAKGCSIRFGRTTSVAARTFEGTSAPGLKADDLEKQKTNDLEGGRTNGPEGESANDLEAQKADEGKSQ